MCRISCNLLISAYSEINVMMDISFLTSMQSQVDSDIAFRSIYTSIATLLSKTSQLSELRLAVRDAMAWNAFPLIHAHGVSIDRAFRQALQRLAQFSLPRLTSMHLDGMEGIASLLSLAPNLHTLGLSLSAGFAISVNQDLVQALELVPRLKKLAYSADTLRITPALRSSEVTQDPSSVPKGSADVLIAIGQKLPMLESLDLRTRWFSEGTYFCSSSEPICPVVSHLLVQILHCGAAHRIHFFIFCQ